MSDLGAVLSSTLSMLQMEFTLGSLTFSFWQIILWLIVAGAVIYLVVKWVFDR